ncbi:MAG: outer membrane beta-barrel protein [Parachlamydia sp.]|jgi:opacity protein-like surface antigen|nr:outer membrane beta-barrel protein [Parachlamydia sp.]
MMKYAFAIAIGLFSSLQGEVKGKVDVGPAYLSIDILESGKTEEELSMWAIKGDATLVGWRGLSLKPGFLYGEGNHKSEIAAFTIGVGQYVPVSSCFSILPYVGVTFTYLHTHIDIEELGVFHLKERFRSNSPFVALEFSYQFWEGLTLNGLYQYAWSHTHTKIKPFVSDKSHTQGPNYALGLEYTMTPNWAVNLGAGYNITLSKEKHGLRGKGVKLGLAYYF